MSAITDRNSLALMQIFNTPIMTYVDQDGYYSKMKWIPRFVACRALSSAAAVATPSGTVGDWFHPRLIQPSWVLDQDYEIVGLSKTLTSGTLVVGKWYKIVDYHTGDDFTNVGAPQNVTGQWFCATGTTPANWANGSVLESEYMGGFWVDMYLCSSPDATDKSAGSVCDGTPGKRAYVSAPMRVPRVNQTIAHFRQYLKSRFDYGGFVEWGQGSSYTGWAGKGGLITDAHWFELWIWTRINRWLLRGNTNGYFASNHIPQWHLDPNDIGILDVSLPSSYGASLTGGGSPLWEIPVSDFCGNRWEFTDGLRLYNGGIYTAGKTVNPFTNPTDGYGHPSFINTGLSISGVTSGQSIASYRTESVIKLHGIAASTTTPGQGGFDGQGWAHNPSGEMVPLRGTSCSYGGERAPGGVHLGHSPLAPAWYVGARAVLVP